MRLTKEQLVEITGCRLRSKQAQWFKDYLGVDVECDRKGPILTVAVYEDLVKRRYGLQQQPTDREARPRPVVRLVRGANA